MVDTYSAVYHAAVIMAEVPLLNGAYADAWDLAWQANYEAAVAASGQRIPDFTNFDDDDHERARMAAYLVAGREQDCPSLPFIAQVLYALSTAIPVRSDALVSEAAREIADALANWTGAVSAVVTAASSADTTRRRGLRRLFSITRSRADREARMGILQKRADATLLHLDEVAHKHADRGTAIDALFLLVDTLELEVESRVSRGDHDGATRIFAMGRGLLNHLGNTAKFLEISEQQTLGLGEA